MDGDDFDDVMFLRDALVFMDMRDSGKSFDECEKAVNDYINQNMHEILDDIASR